MEESSRGLATALGMGLLSGMFLILALLACQNATDADGDGVRADRDCDDQDASVGAGELSWADLDGDGYGQDALWAQACPGDAAWVQRAGDCDDADPTEHPGQSDCNCERGDRPAVGWYTDSDGDGVGAGEPVSQSCGGGEGLASSTGDCAPLDSEIHPGAEEIWYDGQDQNCDGRSDYDADQDGHDSSDYGGADCDDQAVDTHPDAGEICDEAGVDEDCDGLSNAEDPSARGWSSWYVDEDGDGYGVGASVLACAPAESFARSDGDCEDSDVNINPGQPEICGDGVENDCEPIVGECGVHGNGTLTGDAAVPIEGVSGGYLSAGDIEGSGESVVLVGAPFVYESGDYKGSVKLLRAGATVAEDFVNSETAYTTLGTALAAGDVDGDGQQDLLLGATTHLEAGIYTSRVFLGLGPVSAGSVVDDWPSVQGSNIGLQLAVVPGFMALVDGNARGTDQSAGVVYLFGPDPGPQASVLDADGSVYWTEEEEPWSGYTTVFGTGLVACDLSGSGEPGLVVSMATSGEQAVGLAWAGELEDESRGLASADLLVVAETHFLGRRLLACGDLDGDGYPEVVANTEDYGSAFLVFQADEMGQSSAAPWVRFEGLSVAGGVLSADLSQDLDGDGSLDLVLGDGSASPYGAVEVLYGPHVSGSYALGEDRFTGSPGFVVGYGVAALGEGLWTGTTGSSGGVWTPSGPGI